MSGRSLLGLVVFDALLLGAGLAVVFALAGRLDLKIVARLGGLAFCIGVALSGLLLTLIAVLTSLGPRWWLVVAVCAGIAVAGALVGRVRPVSTPLRTGGEGGTFGLAAAPFAAATALMLAALFTASYNRPLFEWDSWAFWIPKAKLLFYSGHLDAAAISSFTAGSYPLLVPVLHAAAFDFMGSADEVSLHVQPWVFMAAFVWACVGMLRSRAPHALIWPFLALLVVLPAVDQRVLQPDGDYPSFLFFVLGAVALLCFVEEQHPLALASGTIFLAASASAKREGTIFLLAAFAAALAVTVREPRRRWPPLVLGGALALSTTVPWRLWVRYHGVSAGTIPPPISDVIGGSRSGNGGVWDGFEVVMHYLFSYSYWSIAPWIGLVMIVSAAVFGPRRIALFASVALAIVVTAMVWRILWYHGQLDPLGTPIPRLAVIFSMLTLAVSPLIAARLLALQPGGICSRVLARADRAGERIGRGGVLALAAGPVAIFLLVGLGRGDYAFVAGRCEPPVRQGGRVNVVFGYPSSYGGALALRGKAEKVGFTGLKTGFDQCGRLRLAVENVSAKVGREIQSEARPVGFAPKLVGRRG